MKTTKSPFKTIGKKGTEKQIARIKMVAWILKSKIFGKTLTLPFSGCDIEKMIAKKTQAIQFFGCDTDMEIVKQMRKTIVKFDLPFYGSECCKISDRIYSAKENEYAHLILDYCGHLNKVKEEIKFAIEKDIVKVGGTIAITIEERANNNSYEIVEEMQNLAGKEFEKGAKILQTTEYFLRAVGRLNYKLVESFRYHDDKTNGNKGANMLLMIVKRIK